MSDPMQDAPKSPIRPTDDEARTLAQTLMRAARFAALATLEGGRPQLSRVAFGRDPAGQPLSLVSTLAAHTRALQNAPDCALMIGEPGDKGDPLTHPRLSLTCQAECLPNTTEEHKTLAAHYLRDHPKAKLYIGFGDFHFVRFHLRGGFLNGGFGKAFELGPEDLRPL